MSTTTRARPPRRQSPRAGISPERRRGLVRLAILIGSAIGLVVLGLNVVSGGSGSGGQGSSGGRVSGQPPPSRLRASIPTRLPVALHGDAVASTPGGLLVVGGEDPSATSSDSVYRFDPLSLRAGVYGKLTQPLHDAAAATVHGQTLVFGGGDTTQFDTVQAVKRLGTATTVGHLPVQLSDLSAVPLAGGAFIVGGFNGTSPSAAVYLTTDGQKFEKAAQLPTPVRYAATATIGDKIYIFGGELANGSDTNEIQEFDVGTERAVIAGHLSAPTAHAAAVTIDGAIYVLGGRVNGAASDRILRFDPARNVAVPAGRLPQPVYDGAAGTYQGRGYLIGGLDSSGSPLNTVIALH